MSRYIPYPELSQKLIDIQEEMVTIKAMLLKKQQEVEKNYFLFLIAGGTEVETGMYTYADVSFFIKNMGVIMDYYPNDTRLEALKKIHFRMQNISVQTKKKLLPRNMLELIKVEDRYQNYVDKMKNDG